MRTLAIALAVSFFGLLTTAHAQTRVVFGLSTEGFLAAPFFIAEAKGYFEKEGIEAKSMSLEGGPRTLAATLSGDVDVMAAASIATVIQAQVRHQDIKAFAALSSELASALVVQPDIMQKSGVTQDSSLMDRLKLLKGLRIAITGPGSSTDKLARYLSSAAGYEPDRDVTIVPVGNSAAILASFSQRRIDAFILSSPTPEIAEAEYGGKILVNFAKGEFEPLQHFLYSCLAARADWLKSHPDTARAVVRAIARAEVLIHEHPEEAKAALVPYFKKLKSNILTAAFDNNLSAYPSSPRIDPAGLDNALAFTAETEGTRLNLTAEDLYTDEFYK